MITTMLLAAAVVAPPAWVLEHEDQWTGTALGEGLLREAGFVVQELNPSLDWSQMEPGVVLLGSFSTEHPDYSQIVASRTSEILEWITRGGILVQLAQADQVESSPTFLPEGLAADRDDYDAPEIHILRAEHPLLEGLEQTVYRFHESRTSWETFRDHRGFEVLASADWEASRPALMTATLGKGAIVLASLPIDKTISPPSGASEDGAAQHSTFARTLFRNLATWAGVARGEGLPTHRASLSAREFSEKTEGSWSLVVLPDTQVYSQSYPGVLAAQTAWIRSNRNRWDIRYVLHLGDITNWNNEPQWQNARDAMSLLDGVVPYSLAPGNHDYGPGGNASTRETLLNNYFDFEAYASQPGFSGAYEEGQVDNSFHTFSAGGREWLVFALEWAPRDEVVEWANQVASAHPDHLAILTTHAYMYSDETRYDWSNRGEEQNWNPHAYATPGSVNDGEELWEKLVRRHRFVMTLNGHVLNDGTAHLVSEDDRGRSVHQMLMNYQTWTLGGNGYLRILEFLPDGRTVKVKAYSPLLDRFVLRPDHSFEIRIDP